MTGQDLARGAGTLLWRQIAERLERDIVVGRRQPGEQLPTEHQLAGDFGVNRHTVRRAVAELAEQGLVRIEQGRGTFVQESVIDYRVKKRTRFSETVAGHNREPSGRTLAVREEAAEAAVARSLEIRKGSLVVVIERLGEADGRPVSVSSHYFAKARFPSLAAIIAETGSITRSMERLGVGDYTRKVTRVTARAARAGDARLLQQAPNKPILMTESVNVDSSGRPVEYSVARWASDRVQIVFEPGG
ncbi:phosphonate metabolism transcriptional regulator PhnF [Magnetospirillum sp. UT-4]|uniref:phosphonate metabolism transcriptional regulator PhnF n=1 Tax=Magnetospirillum sp. UT-4 TaxID=2681467 RepID=UPI00137FAD52|nr:phosphonate metabolism transcriptional regulator PhnF [Magnetospirillum sp. UT-4]CAA7616888.1 putative transcriptional regulator, GntR family, with an UbiC transcription regulator-associated domain [Magnetospirillum sp. UT-4]